MGIVSSSLLFVKDVFNQLEYFGSVGSEQNKTKQNWIIHDAFRAPKIHSCYLNLQLDWSPSGLSTLGKILRGYHRSIT